MHEPLTARKRPNDERTSSAENHSAVGVAAATMNELGSVLNRAWRNGSRVVGDGMFGSSIEIRREVCQITEH